MIVISIDCGSGEDVMLLMLSGYFMLLIYGIQLLRLVIYFLRYGESSCEMTIIFWLKWKRSIVVSYMVVIATSYSIPTNSTVSSTTESTIGWLFFLLHILIIH